MLLPSAFISSIENVKGFNKEAFEKVHASGEQVTSVRLNPGKLGMLSMLSRLPSVGEWSIVNSGPGVLNHQSSIIKHSNQKIPWNNYGYYLSERPSFTSDPLFHAGAYYVQEASSMFLEEAVKQTVELSQPIKILDLCAAPGGKSTLLQSLISNESLLVSNEVIKTRVTILSENISKWGAANVIVTNNDAKDFKRLPDYFDAIVIDAPCSGSGLFRKDPDAIGEWSIQNVQLCSQRQQRILADVLPALKENGILIYSTCSYSEEEDEQITDWLVEELNVESVKLKMENDWGIVETQSPKHNGYGYRFYPDKVKGEGFFIAAFRKTGPGGYRDENEIWKPGRYKSRSERLTNKEAETVKPYLKDPGELFFIRQNDEAVAIPKFLEDDLTTIQNALYIKKAGVKLGSVIREELIPGHDLALSTIINSGLPSVGVDLETALQYLRKQEIKIDTGMKGWALLTYQELPLGWIKILPGRVNNYYPKEWRILNR